MSTNGISLIFDSLTKSGLIKENSFSFYFSKVLNDDKSALVLGGVNMVYAASPFHYYPVVSDYTWTILISSVVYLDNNVKKTTEPIIALIDSGKGGISVPNVIF